MKYIHVKNWDRYQHPDTKRHERSVPWIKSYTQQLNELEWLELSFADIGLLEAIRLQYGENRAKGVRNQRASLSKLFGKSPRPGQIERLCDAGYLLLSASETLAERLPNASLDSDSDSDSDNNLATASREDVSSDSSSASVLATSAGDIEQQSGLEPEFDADADIVLPSSSTHRSRSHNSEPVMSGRPRDELWDELERLFGVALPKTSAHGARNKAVRELRLYGATAELVRLAARRWVSLYPSANLTDSAIAKHWPQLTAGARQGTGAPACDGCGVGGGFHGADCPTVVEAPPGDLERFLNDEGTEAA